MPYQLNEQDYLKLKHSLPSAFHERFINEEAIVAQAYPLLDMVCIDRELIDRLRCVLNLPRLPTGEILSRQIAAIQNALLTQFNHHALFQYRLPVVLSEFPIHSRVINKAIQNFNVLIEAYHQGVGIFLDNDALEERYKTILTTVNEHGSYCNSESIWQLMLMMAGWSMVPLSQIVSFEEEESSFNVGEEAEIAPPVSIDIPVAILELPQPTTPVLKAPFTPDYSYKLNGAGRLARTVYLTEHAFSAKFGGHFDAQEKSPPSFIFIAQLHALISRQLSHRLEDWPTEQFQWWMEVTLHRLGVGFIQRPGSDLLVNPFFTKPISFLSSEKINVVLRESLLAFSSEELNPDEDELKILSLYLFELLQGFQFNPAQTLGIGANWDRTIDLTNEDGVAGVYQFPEAEWGLRFTVVSSIRQGPAEVGMNAAIGGTIEGKTLFKGFDEQSTLKKSEHPEVISNALIDNMVADLMPDPRHFENEAYPKYRKQFIMIRNEQGLNQIFSYFQPSKQGTYFTGRGSIEKKQTPMYRRAGTLEVQAFPRNTTYSEQSRVSYDGNPLGALQLQFAQALHKSVRGHYVYDPIAADQFLEDAFYGQVLRSDNGDFIPFIGIIPKNFDRHFKQLPKELCASFVLRMMHSSRIMVYSPTFRAVYQQIITRFLPTKDGPPPPTLPDFCTAYLFEKREKLVQVLAKEERTFQECHDQFYSLFKNLAYSLYEFGRYDEHFKHSFLTYIHSSDTFYPASKSRCEKVIRDLTVNRPLYAPSERIVNYDQTLNYLRDLSAYFYPKPSDALAQKIASQAKLHVKPLVQSPSIKAYFEQLKQQPQANLSRQHTPGMLYAVLKHNGPSKSVADDYNQMYQRSLSYYRDPDGTSISTPQTYERVLDWCAKKLGASLQLKHKYPLFSVITNPLVQWYVHAKERAAAHQYEPLKPLWAVRGAIEGFFWHGLVKGIWQSTTTPFHMLADFLRWQYQLFGKTDDQHLNNPLAIPAAPSNQPGFRELVSANSRDYLLYLLGKQKSCERKKNKVVDYCIDIAEQLYPYLNDDERRFCTRKFHDLFPLSDAEQAELFNPMLLSIAHDGLLTLLRRNNSYINNQLLQAVIRCVTNPLFAQQARTIIKDTQSNFSLNARQNQILADILALYRQLPDAGKSSFSEWFQFNGIIHRTLQRRDQLLQKVQVFILNVFDEQRIQELLAGQFLEQWIAELDEYTLERVLYQLPASLKWPLNELLLSANPQVLDHYELSDSQIEFLIKTLVVFNQITELSKKEQLLKHCAKAEISDEKNLSAKDKAHNMWAHFSERELKHQLLNDHEVNDILLLLTYKTVIINPLIANLQVSYQHLIAQADDEALLLFYQSAMAIDVRLQELISGKTPDRNLMYTEARILLRNFLNVTMNALVNSRLDGVDIFVQDFPKNPLLASQAIESWFIELQSNNRDLRSLLEQQVQQTSSLDQSLWRLKCILQVLELREPTKKIAKTGMQSLLRFWSYHKENVTVTGEQYLNQDTGAPDKCAPEVLFHDSMTLTQALTRVRAKIPGLSFFNPLPPAPSAQEAQSSLPFDVGLDSSDSEDYFSPVTR